MKYLLSSLLFFFCLLTYSQNPFDCENALIICGDSSIGLNPSGIGFDEFSLPGNEVPPCYSFNQHSIWFKFIIDGAGDITFDIIPDDGADYDFAIFGPDPTCTSLGAAIRCSSTNPENAGVSPETGLNLTETDVNEGPGEDGNGYLRFIEAEAGDVYYLLVDRAVGSGGFSLFYTGTATLPSGVTANPVDDLVKCDTDGNPNDRTIFNLASLTSQIQGTQTNAPVSFHTSLNDANIGINDLPDMYENISNPQTIFARIENQEGCADYTSFQLVIDNPRLVEPIDEEVCSYNASEDLSLLPKIDEIIADPTGLNFSFHRNIVEASNGQNDLGNTAEITETPRTIFIRAEDKNDPLCFSITSFDALINRIQIAQQPVDIVECDDNFDAKITVNLQDKNEEIIGTFPSEDFEVYYYRTPEDRADDIERIIGNYQNESSPQTIYVAFVENATQCVDFVNFDIIVNPLPIPEFSQDEYKFCLNLNESVEIEVGDIYEYYVWSTGEEGPDLNSIFVSEPGVYDVTVTNNLGCTNTSSVTVSTSDIATITNIEVDDFNQPENSITVTVDGIGDYEYSLDDSEFQDSNTFTNLLNGYYIVSVRDKNDCGVVNKEVLVLDYPKFFTPNQDGYNDTWKITGISEFPATVIHIYNRYGKPLKSLSPTSNGWNGIYQGEPLPFDDYWFSIKIKDRPEFRGHFTLKR